MKLTRFEISNFKGVDSTSIHLSDGTPGNVVTLIGLNESGKTTILEALSHFITEDKDTAGLVGTVAKKSPLHDLIPKDRKAAFTGRISIKAFVILDDEDVRALAAHYLEDQKLTLNTRQLSRSLQIDTAIDFIDSKHKESKNYWNLTFQLRPSADVEYSDYGGLGPDMTAEKTVWLVGINFLRSRLPKLVYFPTFLFSFPDRIYLEGDKSEINAYYLQVVQDVLDSQGEGLTIQRHILDRIAAVKAEQTTPATFFASLFQRDEKKQIDAVLQKASTEMSRVIFGSWNQILGRSVTGKRCRIDWLLDSERENAPYLEVSIVDGESNYSLSERSLGFRWFFSFLLFTQFRKNRKTASSTIFLFDEPAANLHSKAQTKLLESFSRIAQGNTYIIYSTHSHYMVNPMWLEKAYIVENSATDYDSKEDIDAFAVGRTDIRAIRYRTFVGSNPTKTTYFQPVLDALEVTFSPLLRSADALIVEGKNDFFPILYLRSRLGAPERPEIFPGNGAGHAGTLIGLFRGWGVRFRVLLDDDRAGREAKKKYREDYLLKDDEVATLGDISDSLKGKVFEDIFQDDVRAAVGAYFSVAEPSKKQYALYFQELWGAQSDAAYSLTEDAFKPLSAWIDGE